MSLTGKEYAWNKDSLGERLLIDFCTERKT